MPTDRLTPLLQTRLDELRTTGRLKGAEAVSVGVLPPADGKGPRFLIEGHGQRPFLRMNSNSYLGMSFATRVMEAEEEAVRRYGIGPGAVRFISGTWAPHVKLEARLAAFHGREAGMLFSSAYATVMGVLPPLITDKTAVISDALNHNSIINAISLSRPAEKRIYAHLDYDALERHLASLSKACARAVVVTDGVFSMRGDHADLGKIMQIAAKYDASYAENVIVVADDSHGVGGFGATGRGTEEIVAHEGRRPHRHARQGVRRQRRLCGRGAAGRRLSARDIAVLHLLEPDHTRRSGGRACGGRSRRQRGGARAARPSASNDAAIPRRAAQARS